MRLISADYVILNPLLRSRHQAELVVLVVQKLRVNDLGLALSPKLKVRIPKHFVIAIGVVRIGGVYRRENHQVRHALK